MSNQSVQRTGVSRSRGFRVQRLRRLTPVADFCVRRPRPDVPGRPCFFMGPIPTHMRIAAALWTLEPMVRYSKRRGECDFHW